MQAESHGAGTGLREPVAFVHNGFTERSAWQRVRDLLPVLDAACLAAGKMALVNVWRPIGASAERFPLAAANGRSMPPADHVAVDMIYADRVGEGCRCTDSAGQGWFYVGGIRNDEAMLLKCFDSAADGRTCHTAHTGFENPAAAPDAPPRRSIEVRAILAFDA